MVYDGAIYLHQGEAYLCTHLDLAERVAHVRPARVKYYTSVGDALAGDARGWRSG